MGDFGSTAAFVRAGAQERKRYRVYRIEKHRASWPWRIMPMNAALGKLLQEECEFKANLGYTVRLGRKEREGGGIGESRRREGKS